MIKAATASNCKSRGSQAGNPAIIKHRVGQCPLILAPIQVPIKCMDSEQWRAIGP